MEFGVWEGLQSIGNGCGLQMDGFSAQTEPYESIFDDFHDFDDFGIVFVGLTLLPEGPRTLREYTEGPGSLLRAHATPAESPQSYQHELLADADHMQLCDLIEERCAGRRENTFAASDWQFKGARLIAADPFSGRAC